MNRVPPSAVRRRPVLKAAGGVAALAAVGGTTRVVSNLSQPARKADALMLETHETPDMASLELPVDPRSMSSLGARRWRSDQLDTTTYTMAAFVWAVGSKEVPSFRLRARAGKEWGPWRPVPSIHGGQDASAEAGSSHTGTELVWAGRSNAIEYEVSGRLPDNLRLVLLYPRPRRSDTTLGSRTDARLSSRVAAAELKPSVLPRQDWGADETWRNGNPAYNHLMQQVHIHHTANGNDYSSDQVPAMLRGIYRYHTRYLGWSDIAYNFLVDRFGMIWEGRAGGTDTLVRGAHTRGFNSSSTGIAVIGNFDQATPSTAIIRSVAQIAAWKVHEYGGRPRGSARVRSEGSDLYKANEVVLLRVIDGHRDTNETACPGRHLYETLPRIRRRAGSLIRAAEAAAAPVTVLSSSSISGTASVGSGLVVQPGTYEPADATLAVAWLRDGVEISGATGMSYVATAEDFGSLLSARVEATYEGRLPATELTVALGPVTAVPSAKILATGGRGRAEVDVSIEAPPGVVGSPTGTVKVRVGGRRRSVRLVDGRARARFKQLHPGRRRVSVRYLGGSGLAPVKAGDIVRVRPR